MNRILSVLAMAVVGLAVQASAADAPQKAAEPQYHEIMEGSTSAKVTVIEFASVTCPHCAAFNNEVYPEIKKRYIDTGKILFIYRDVPTPPQNLAAAAASLARCAPQGKGKGLLDLMFKNQQVWMKAPDETLRAYAQLAGMTSADVDACLASEKVHKEMDAAVARAINVYKVEGTPTFFVNNDKVQSELLEPLVKAIEKNLAAVAK